MKQSVCNKDLHLTHLRSFCKVALHGSFAAAAAELQVSTPTVWQQVRTLEEKLGSRLVVYHDHKTVLTPEGHLLWNLARSHVSGLDSLAHLFHEQRSNLAVTVHFAVPQSILNLYLPRALRAFRAGRSAARLNLIVASEFGKCSQLVQDGTVDLAVVDLDPELERSPALHYEMLFRQRLCLITPTRHSLNRRQNIMPADVVRYPFVLFPRGGLPERALQQWLNRHGLSERVTPVIEVMYLESLARLVADGLGVGAHHMHPSAERKLPGCHVRVLPDVPSDVVVAIVSRQGAHLTRAAESLRATIRRTLQAVEFREARS